MPGSKIRAIVVGIAAGILAEVGALLLSFYGTNLFHGGHPNVIVSALLPGIGIADRLSSRGLPLVPISLMIVSLTQFPVYGALLGRDYVNGQLSRLTLVVMLLHVVGTSLAFYGAHLDSKWEAASAQYGACIRSNASAEGLALNSHRITQLVTWKNQSNRELERLRARKRDGAIFQPDPEDFLIQEIAKWQKELDQQWESYKAAGGPANSPEEVKVLDSPCGKPPTRPTFPHLSRVKDELLNQVTPAFSRSALERIGPSS